MSVMINSWTAERIAELTKRWAGGQSASEIAKALGGVTRSAVRGKALRLGLRPRLEPNQRVVEKTPQKPSAKPANFMAVNVVRKLNSGGGNEPISFIRSVPVTARPWLTRAFGECAFPVAGDGAETMSCCGPAGGQIYCTWHRDIMRAKPATYVQIEAAAKMRETKAKKMLRVA